MAEDDTTERSLSSINTECVTKDVATAGKHVLESSVTVFEEYEQRYDPESDPVVLGPSRIKDHMHASTFYDCTCGASFTDQTEALQHLIDATTGGDE